MSDFSGLGYRCCIVAVNMQHFGASDHLFSDLFRLQPQVFRAPPKDCTLARAVINDDVCRLIGAAFTDLQMIEIDARTGEAFNLNTAPFIVSARANILDA